MKHILVAYDGSEQAEKAFDLSLDFAQRYSAKLTVLAVTNVPESSDDVLSGDILVSIRDKYQNLFEYLKQKAEPFLPLELNFKITEGRPAEKIISVAEELGVDHIVTGHRGNTLFKRWLLGSVAKQVMIYAHCAITIVR